MNRAVFNPFADPDPPVEDPVDPEGEMWWPGVLVKHFKYDGLGRLIVVQSPYPNPDAATGLRSERFYYDGVRRIQEVVIDPLATQDDALNSNDPGLLLAAEGDPEAAPPDPSTSTLQLEEAQTDSPNLTQYLAREYIWGPGDKGLDELLVQYDVSRAPWWMVTDAGGDVVAMCSNPTSGAALVAAQWTYDAYGAVVNESVFVSGSPVNRCGHKGLFVERLDVGVIHAGVEAKRLAVGARLYGHVRNRGYGFETGRWFQADPNATGMVVAESAHHGATSLPLVDHFDVAARYGDGANLYEYLGSNTWIQSDPMGLYLGYDDLALAFVGGMRGGLEAMTEQYASNMEWGADWASDWAMPDDWHSRGDNKWVNLSFAMGFYSGMMEQVEDSLLMNEIDIDSELVLAGSGGGGRGAQRGARAAKLSFKTLRLFRETVMRAATTQYKKTQLSQAGRALAKHPEMAGLSKGPHVERGFQLCYDRFGSVSGINNAADRIAKRIVMQGIPVRNMPQGKIKFRMTDGKCAIWSPPTQNFPEGHFDFWTDGLSR